MSALSAIRHRLRPRQASSLFSTLSSNNNYSSNTTTTTTTSVPSIYVAATRQHVGKTSVSLALMSGLQKRFGNRVGFIKPVGQQSLTLHDPVSGKDNVVVDKDAALIHRHFHLNAVPLDCISPIHIPAGYTKDYLDGKISHVLQTERLLEAHRQIASVSDVIVSEGTGHCAVGSIVDACNAQAASWLGSSMVLVVNAGLGSSFDELVLNQTLCEKYHVPVAGVIVNQIQHDKYDQIKEYMSKALQRKYGEEMPLLGCIPDRPFLGCPALTDLERLLDGKLVSGQQHALRHYRVRQDSHLVACSLEVFLQRLRRQRRQIRDSLQDVTPSQATAAAAAAGIRNDHRTLYICHASRQDILLGFLMEAVQHCQASDSTGSGHWESAMLVTGCADFPLSAQVLEIIQSLPNAPPVLMTPYVTDETLKRMYEYTPKLNLEDPRRVATAIEHYEPYINFEVLLDRVGAVVPTTMQQKEEQESV